VSSPSLLPIKVKAKTNRFKGLGMDPLNPSHCYWSSIFSKKVVLFMSYNYSHWLVNGIELHVIYGPAKDVTLRKISENVTQTSYIGINGGFFELGKLDQIYSITVNNNQPVGGNPGEYSVGWYNIGGASHGYNSRL
jgi:hypothetical protein